MPKSKTHVNRRKRKTARPKSASSRYQLEPDKKQPRKESPRWYGPAILGLMGIGVLLILNHYMQVVTVGGSVFLWVGLGLIAVGFIGTTRWR